MCERVVLLEGQGPAWRREASVDFISVSDRAIFWLLKPSILICGLYSVCVCVWGVVVFMTPFAKKWQWASDAPEQAEVGKKSLRM